MAQGQLMGELGSTGLSRQGGKIQEEYLKELQGEKWFKVVREMTSQDPIIGAVKLSVELLLRQVDVNVQSADDTPQAQDLAEFVGQCLDDMSHSWADTLSEILTFLDYGWAYLELVYKTRGGDVPDGKKRSKYDDGRIGWRKWSIRAQETREEWEFDEEGGISGMWQKLEGGEPVLIPIEKALLFRTTCRKGSPEGRSILRSAYRSYYFKKSIENIEGIGIERDLAGLPVALVPPDILASDASADKRALLDRIREIVGNIRRDEQEGVIWPLAYDDNGNKIFELQLLASSGTRQFDTDKIIARYDQRIAMSVLADFILLGHEQVGSYALSSTKASLFRTALEAWLGSIAGVINTHAIPRLLRLNGFDVALAPTVAFGRVGQIEMAEIIAFVESMTAAGMELFPNVEVENRLRTEIGLPPLSREQVDERERRRDEPQPETDPEEAPDTEPEAERQEQGYSPAEQEAIVLAAARILAGG